MGSQRLGREQFLSVIEAGISAPSADNRHPLSFEQADDSIRVWGTPAFDAAKFHRRILFRIAIGAVVENMVLRAGDLGLETAIGWFPDPAEPSLVAQLTFTGVGATADALSRVIGGRHTNRRIFHGPAIAEAQRQEFAQCAEAIEGTRLVWLDEPRLRSRALRMIRIAEAERFRCKPLHNDLFSGIRFDVGWKIAADEGLSPGSLEVERPLRGAFAALRHWWVMRALTSVGAHRLLGLRAGDIPCRLAPHVGAIATTLDLEPGAIAVGRAFERTWLKATALGMALQPFAACTLFALDGYKDVRDALREELARGWTEIVPGMRPLMVFRMGWGAAPSVTSGRRTLETYLRTPLGPLAD